MKTEGEVRARLQELVQAEVTRRFAEIVERLPHRCVHNHRQPLDARKRALGDPNPQYNRISRENGAPVPQTIGLCMLGAEDPVQWAGSICDEPIDAKRCPYFTPAKSREEVSKELDSQLQDSEWVRRNLPEVHALLWVLGETRTPKLHWWRRWFVWLMRPRLETALPAFDPSKLLPPEH